MTVENVVARLVVHVVVVDWSVLKVVVHDVVQFVVHAVVVENVVA